MGDMDDGEPYFDPKVVEMAVQLGVPVVQMSRDALKREWRLDAMGSTGMPTDPDARLQRYIQLYAAGVVDELAVLQQANIPDAPQIAERMAQRRMVEMMIGGAQGAPGGGGAANTGARAQKPRSNRQVTRDTTREPESRAKED